MATTTAIKRHAPTQDNTIIRMTTPLISFVDLVLAVIGGSVVKTWSDVEAEVGVDEAAYDDTGVTKDVVRACDTVVENELLVVGKAVMVVEEVVELVVDKLAVVSSVE